MNERVCERQKIRRGLGWVLPLSFGVGCVSSAAQSDERWEYVRSPTLDYRPLPRPAGDTVLGAHEQVPEDWLDATLTNEHLGPGWQLVDGELVYVPELGAVGEGAYMNLARCPEELGAPPEELAGIDPGAPEAAIELEGRSPAWYSCPEPD